MIDEELPELKVPLPENPGSPFWIAALIDDVVYQVQNLESQQAALYLAQPKFVRVKFEEAKIGWKYNSETKKFVRPTFNPETDTYSY
jgi:hypothetical protein